MSPADKVTAYATAAGQVLAKGVAAGMFLATGAEVFHLVPDFIEQARAQDIFAGLAGYYGIPFLWGHRPAGRTR